MHRFSSTYLIDRSIQLLLFAQVVLSACSSYFQKLLLSNPCKHPTIIMPQDVCFNDLKFIIEFVYRGEIDVSQAELQVRTTVLCSDQLYILTLDMFYRSIFLSPVLCVSFLFLILSVKTMALRSRNSARNDVRRTKAIPTSQFRSRIRTLGRIKIGKQRFSGTNKRWLYFASRQ